MKSLPPYSEGPQWNRRLTEDLTYIKKHRRYPMNKRTTTILIVKILPAFLLVAFIIWLNVLHITTHNKSYFPFVFPILLLPTIISLFRYPGTLKFVAIHTPFYSYENQQVVEKFLEIQNLVIFRHPDAPDVFQIVSKSMNNRKDVREVMLFIADDKQILINSHFTDSGYTLFPPTRHYEVMAKKLREWLTIYNPGNDYGIVSASNF